VPPVFRSTSLAESLAALTAKKAGVAARVSVKLVLEFRGVCTAAVTASVHIS
jgi:hypothetical protein